MDKIQCPKCGATGDDVTYQNITFYHGAMAETYWYCSKCETDLVIYYKATRARELRNDDE